ncbi:MAG: GAF domain-containing protein [Prevotella sp.]|nr:GAF domain-containing protein [Prevotella sp.]
MNKGIQIESREQSDRQEVYLSLIPQLESLIAGESNLVGVLANVTAALRTAFGERFFWVGFYIVEGERLQLGPFQGTVACFSIGRGRGVCGAAWVREKTVIVDDVEQFPGHIACSSLSRSEIVVPVKGTNGEVVAVLDIDSTELKSFDDTDREGLESICAILGPLFH